MCRFLALAVKNGDSARSALAEFYVYPNSNKSLLKTVPGNYTWLWVTDGHCSCGLFDYPFDLEAEIEKIRTKYTKPKYKKQGWTERRIEEKIKSLRKKEKSRPGGLDGKLYAVLKEYVGSAGECFLYLGWASGAPDDEAFSVSGCENFEIRSELNTPWGIGEGRLYKLE